MFQSGVRAAGGRGNVKGGVGPAASRVLRAGRGARRLDDRASGGAVTVTVQSDRRIAALLLLRRRAPDPEIDPLPLLKVAPVAFALPAGSLVV